ncbi:hypothetical protein AMJ57_00600 [Parcubacteria bacterium SG8_24]|nr:MAG: hypothetical protein AMJ57_00600 [Parcubacteria bacterium SG8_24]
MIFEPRTVVEWDAFSSEYPPFSIAVDGYCKGAPRSTPDGLILNINHHEDVDSMATRSSCEQALCLVKLGLYKTFQTRNGKPKATLYLNDCDQDVVLATYVLSYPDHVPRARLRELVRLEDHLDMSAGLFPADKSDSQLIRQLAWISEPYTEARHNGELTAMDARNMKALVEEMHRRVRSTLFGRGKELQLDTRFEVLGSYQDWALVRSVGIHARFGMASKGITAYVELRASEGDRYHYALGRLSSFIPFPVKLICLALNEAEGIDDLTKGWGGGKNHGGSPRELGSKLPPEEVGRIIEGCIALHRRIIEEKPPETRKESPSEAVKSRNGKVNGAAKQNGTANPETKDPDVTEEGS